jgi:hypothetical protein
MEPDPDLGKCFYCTRPLDGNQEPDHILPAAIGAELTTAHACSSCRRRCAVQVEQPWLHDPLVASALRRWPVRRQSTGVGRHGNVNGAAGGRLESDTPIRSSPSEVPVGEGLRLIDDTQAQRARRVRRLNRTYSGLNLIQPGTAPGAPPSAGESQIGSRDTWSRFGAKVALAVASLVTDDGWLDTPGAKALQDVLWNGYTPELDSPGDRRWTGPSLLHSNDLIRSPEHLLAIEPAQHHGSSILIVIFGELGYRVPLPIEYTIDDAESWWFSPSNWSGRQLRLEEQLASLRARRARRAPRDQR